MIPIALLCAAFASDPPPRSAAPPAKVTPLVAPLSAPGASSPPTRCPPRAAGVPDVPPAVQRSAVGAVPLALWRCPADSPPGDVVHLVLGASASIRLIDDDNWVSGGVVREDNPEVAGSSVEVLGPAAGDRWAVLVRTRDCCWGTGSLSVYVVDGSGVAAERSFPGGAVSLRDGLLVGVDGPLNTDAQAQVVELDAVVEWRDGGWVQTAPQLRVNHTTWPCDDRLVPRLAADGSRVGEFRLLRDSPLDVLGYHLAADGSALFRVRVGETEGWTEGIEQGCLG